MLQRRVAGLLTAFVFFLPFWQVYVQFLGEILGGFSGLNVGLTALFSFSLSIQSLGENENDHENESDLITQH
jgi:hypothetical protein